MSADNSEDNQDEVYLDCPMLDGSDQQTVQEILYTDNAEQMYASNTSLQETGIINWSEPFSLQQLSTSVGIAINSNEILQINSPGVLTLSDSVESAGASSEPISPVMTAELPNIVDSMESADVTSEPTSSAMTAELPCIIDTVESADVSSEPTSPVMTAELPSIVDSMESADVSSEPTSSAMSAELPSIVDSVPLKVISSPMTVVESSDTYLIPQYFVENSEVEKSSLILNTVDYSDSDEPMMSENNDLLENVPVGHIIESSGTIYNDNNLHVEDFTVSADTTNDDSHGVEMVEGTSTTYNNGRIEEMVESTSTAYNDGHLEKMIDSTSTPYNNGRLEETIESTSTAYNDGHLEEMIESTSTAYNDGHLEEMIESTSTLYNNSPLEETIESTSTAYNDGHLEETIESTSTPYNNGRLEETIESTSTAYNDGHLEEPKDITITRDKILDEKTVSDNTNKSDQNEFLTSCDLKKSAEDESSRESSLDQELDGKIDTNDSKKADNEPEFIWEKYLEETDTVPVPPTAFRHVEYSLESGFVKGMKLEVPNKCNTDTYWVASVLMTCGPLLRLRFDGYEEDNTADFWCDLMTSEIHPIGWCAQNNQILQPPEAIKDKFDDWRDFLVRSLTGARTAPSYLLDKNTGITPIDQLKTGMRLEIQHPINPLEVWLVKILENVGGRLYLRFEGVEKASHDFWLFYLNHRLHPIGWAKSNGYKYQPPQELVSEDGKTEWLEILKTALKEAEKYILPLAIFKDQEDIPDHSFQEGWKLEALNPIDRNQICPATVVRVLNKKYFVVEIDDLSTKEEHGRVKFSCHAGSKCIFPVKWSYFQGIAITPPAGWPKSSLSWSDYLEYCKAEAAPDVCFPQKKFDLEFEQGMKIEAVNPENPNQICVSTISKVIEPLIWIHLEISPFLGTSHIEHFDSHNIFPVGWCESNGYQLRSPVKLSNRRKELLPEISDATSEAYHMNKGGAWCPKVYYNHQCFSGPYLSKGRIASLPKCIGPGPICLVMKESISMLINVAYKPCRVLKELQLEGKPNADMYQQVLKAKYKGKSYRAVVEICQDAEKLAEFCKKICLKLECCPNLVSPTFINGKCPENCSQLTKTKYTYYNPKKKIGRPPGGHTNLENGPKKPGKKKKGRRMKILSHGDSINGDENGSVNDGDDDKESIASDTKTVDSVGTNESSEKGVKRKYVHQVPAPSDIKTRGAKLPKYSFERKTHKKIPVQEKQHLSQQNNKPKKQHANKIPVSPVKNVMKLDSNPLHWSVKEVVNFIKGTECAPLARTFIEQEIDGQAFLLLTLPTVQEYLELKLGPAVKLCHHIEQIRLAFFQQYAK